MLVLLPLCLSLLPGALSRPTPSFGLRARTNDPGTPTPLSAAMVNSTFLRPALFARVAFCSSASIEAWSCGAPCDALTNVTFLQAGGNEGTIPLCKYKTCRSFAPAVRRSFSIYFHSSAHSSYKFYELP
ncbi:hypothetical protein K438DRAFT_2059214, partial [Mycena galopus ATCC 62051]